MEERGDQALCDLDSQLLCRALGTKAVGRLWCAKLKVMGIGVG